MTQEQLSISLQIRQVGIAEGISYLILLFVAMPLKYIWHMPEVVRYTGWVHGVLFMLFMYMIWLGRMKLNWTVRDMVAAFAASFLPFGTFWLDRKLVKAEK